MLSHMRFTGEWLIKIHMLYMTLMALRRPTEDLTEAARDQAGWPESSHPVVAVMIEACGIQSPRKWSHCVLKSEPEVTSMTNGTI